MLDKEITKVFTIGEIAKIYRDSNLTESAIRRGVRAGDIKSRKVWVKFLVSVEAVESWLNPLPEQHDSSHDGHIRRVDG